MERVIKTPLLTVKEVAERLQASESTVRKWISSGQLKSVKVSHLRRVREEDLEAFIKETPVAEKMAGKRGFRPFTFDNPIFDLMGAGTSGQNDISQNHHEYLGKIYRRKHLKDT